MAKESELDRIRDRYRMGAEASGRVTPRGDKDRFDRRTADRAEAFSRADTSGMEHGFGRVAREP